MAKAKAKVSGMFAVRLEAAAAGPAAKDMLRRGLRVKAAAQRALETAPRRVDSGKLKNSIYVRQVRRGSSFGVMIGSDLKYAMWVHNGTGIYGPRRRRITPRRAKYLRFVPKGGTRAIYRKSVKGMKPNPFLQRGLRAARG